MHPLIPSPVGGTPIPSVYRACYLNTLPPRKVNARLVCRVPRVPSSSYSFQYMPASGLFIPHGCPVVRNSAILPARLLFRGATDFLCRAIRAGLPVRRAPPGFSSWPPHPSRLTAWSLFSVSRTHECSTSRAHHRGNLGRYRHPIHHHRPICDLPFLHSHKL